MNILFIQKTTGRGGAKNSLLESLSVLRAENHIFPQVIIGEQGPLSERCMELGVPVSMERLPEWRKFFDRLFFSKQIRAISRKHLTSQIDWVISNEMWWGPHAARLAKELGCRSAVILRDGIATVKKARQYGLEQNDLLLPVSSTLADTLCMDSTLKNRVHVLFNAVTVPPAHPGDDNALERLLKPYPHVGRWLLIVGKLSHRKNQADAVRVLHALREAGHTDLGLLLAGDIDPSYREVMTKAMHALDQVPQVALIGNFNGVAALMKRAHTVLLPSLREGLPRSLVEGITEGKVAFSYPCEGVEDIFLSHRPRFSSKAPDADSLTHTILEAWAAPAETRCAFDAVQRSVLERFSPDAHRKRFLTLLNA